MVVEFLSYTGTQAEFWTPPGFSRWYFNFSATPERKHSSGHHQALAGGGSILQQTTIAYDFHSVAEKLKDHRLKPGGVQSCVCVSVVAEKLKDHRLKPGGVGKLTKSKDNRTLVEWPVKFKVIHQGC